LSTTIDLDSLDFAALVQPGARFAWGQAGAEPTALTTALMAQRQRIGRCEAFVGIGLSDTPDPTFTDAVRFASYCGSGTNRRLAKAGRLDIHPVAYSSLSEVVGPPDVLLLQVAPARDGRYSLGIAHDYLVPWIDAARLVIAEVNDQTPWTYGERSLGADDIDLMVETSRPPLEFPVPRIGPAEAAIARRVAGLIEDGATLQLGIGGLPEAILRELGGHRDLGVHSGAIGDGIADLMEAGVVTNARKAVDPGVTVGGLLLGTRRVYRFAHANPDLRFAAATYTHGADVLARQERLVALNAAIEVDLTGQVNAEVAAGTYLGSVGGAGDFLRGAGRARGGLPIVALASTVGPGGASRIVSRLSGPVSTARSDAGLVVTEHGVADLRGRTLRERKTLMIALADPAHRDALAATEIDD
jgi:acyl-CoA hydrolase